MTDKVKDILRTHVHKHEYPVDPAEIWAGMQKEIIGEQKKDKRKLFGIFFSVALIGLISIMVINFGQGDTNQISDISVDETIETNSNQINSNVVEGHSSPEQEEQVANQNIPNQKLKNLALENQADTKEKVESKVSKETKNIVSAITAVEEPTVSQNTTSISTSTTTPSSIMLNQNSSNFPILVNKGSSNSSDESNSDSNEEINRIQSIDEVGNQIQKEELVLFEIRNSIQSMQTLQMLRNSLLANSEQKDFVFDKEQFSKIDAKKFKAQKASVSVSAGLGLFTKKIIAFNESHKAYANARENYEKPLELITAQALVMIPLGSNFSISSGIHYLQFNEELDWEGTYYLDGNGNHIPSPSENLIGQSYYQEINHSLTNYNQSKLIAVPILIGVNDRVRRLTYGLKAGVNVQLKTETAGKVLNENLIPLNSLSHKFGLGLHSKAELAYVIFPGFELLGELSVLQVSTIEEIVNQRIRSYSVGLGLRKSL